jgi:hypothetical protein
VDTDAGKFEERQLQRREDAEKFYRDLAVQGMKVRGETSGHAGWFERLLAELNVGLWIGDAAEIGVAVTAWNLPGSALRSGGVCRLPASFVQLYWPVQNDGHGLGLRLLNLSEAISIHLKNGRWLERAPETDQIVGTAAKVAVPCRRRRYSLNFAHSQKIRFIRF